MGFGDWGYNVHDMGQQIPESRSWDLLAAAGA